MQALVDMDIFKVITVYDLQALCEERTLVPNDGPVFSAVSVTMPTSANCKFHVSYFSFIAAIESHISDIEMGASRTVSAFCQNQCLGFWNTTYVYTFQILNFITHALLIFFPLFYCCIDDHVIVHDDDDDAEFDNSESITKKPVYVDEEDEEEKYFNRPIVPKYETTYRACDKKSDLYLLQQERFLKGKPPPSKGPEGQSSYSR